MNKKEKKVDSRLTLCGRTGGPSQCPRSSKAGALCHEFHAQDLLDSQGNPAKTNPRARPRLSVAMEAWWPCLSSKSQAGASVSPTLLTLLPTPRKGDSREGYLQPCQEATSQCHVTAPAQAHKTVSVRGGEIFLFLHFEILVLGRICVFKNIHRSEM